MSIWEWLYGPDVSFQDVVDRAEEDADASDVYWPDEEDMKVVTKQLLGNAS